MNKKSHGYLRTLLPAAAVALLVLAVSPALWSIGRITYLEGDVQLIRGGEVRDQFQLSPGDALQAMDVLQTGFDGYAEVELSAGGRTEVRIRENTAWYVEVTGEDGNSEARLKLLNGSVEMAVRQVSRGSRVSVETRSAVFGVRGTEFDVISAPDESNLLGVRRGQVAVTAGGQEAVAEQGVAVQVEQNQPPRSQTVPQGDFDSFYASWMEARLQVFRSGAATFNRAYARRFEDTVDNFDAARGELLAFRSQLREALANQSALGQDMQLRTEISPAIIRARSILPLFEDTVYRLRELRRYHDQGIGETTINGQSSRQFFAAFARREDQLIRQLSEVRAMLVLYGELERRSFGGLPGGGGPGGTSPFGGGGSLLDSMGF